MAVAVPRLRTERARQELGWAPRHGVDETLSHFVAALREGQRVPGPLLSPQQV
jgi:nucleoside-diphosphate-sugar epimerase